MLRPILTAPTSRRPTSPHMLRRLHHREEKSSLFLLTLGFGPLHVSISCVSSIFNFGQAPIVPNFATGFTSSGFIYSIGRLDVASM
ncbi:hypothetical protein V1527DRAFT_476149, partial [Lipomyces starkeyi]